MKILLSAATPPELGPVLHWLRDRAMSSERNVLRFGSLDVHLLFTGMGPMATAYALGSYFARQSVDLAIQAGIAGALDTTLEIGEVVRVQQDTLVDFGAEDKDQRWLSLPDMGFAYASPYQADGSLRPVDTAAQYLPYRSVRGGTTARASGSTVTIDRIRERFPEVQIETMEGAAFFYAAQSSGVPCLQLRSISNYVTERDRESWNIGLAIKTLNEALENLLTAFTAQA
ncbi:futalosine hydrolase [Lewinella sp. IMCC34191]|uniref:futalosine hydrolase n=1 Tax=Lewinella sp. IMCC34191 TaxID=2259172 RepID=UPI000E232493|nr:futalosine hydrolase [Lewinella sp. IMCC34191]